MSTRPKAAVLCQIHVRLDGLPADADKPESEADYSERYRAFWLRLEAWLRVEGIEPTWWPSVLQWWKVSFCAGFRVDEVERVAEWLRGEGVEVEYIHGIQYTAEGQ